ncbi:MAG: helix-turn-helix transcriptional regulator [Clostridia bacterium]|nr:helix-turn-helix transcriptional regulator [Clostridia bacterium]
MIRLNEKQNLEFVTIGLFDTDAEWTHPIVTIETYELIFVLAGDVRIFESERRYTVRPGEMLLLAPGVEHGGFEKNMGRTAFYWLHFHTDDIGAWGIAKQEMMPPNTEKIFRELMHLWQTHRELTEVTLVKFLLENSLPREYKNKIAYEVREYLRVHVRENLRVEGVARLFGYSADHLSRIYKQEFGHDLKEGIVRQKLTHIESLLMNTDYSIKEIAHMSGFEDENIFVKFFKYHEKITPKTYRNRFFHIHMNNR